MLAVVIGSEDPLRGFSKIGRSHRFATEIVEVGMTALSGTLVEAEKREAVADEGFHGKEHPEGFPEWCERFFHDAVGKAGQSVRAGFRAEMDDSAIRKHGFRDSLSVIDHPEANSLLGA